jgi:hypothetical protein
MIDSLKETIMQRDNLSASEAEFLIEDFRQRVFKGEDIREILLDEFGLELDYVIDLLLSATETETSIDAPVITFPKLIKFPMTWYAVYYIDGERFEAWPEAPSMRDAQLAVMDLIWEQGPPRLSFSVTIRRGQS